VDESAYADQPAADKPLPLLLPWHILPIAESRLNQYYLDVFRHGQGGCNLSEALIRSILTHLKFLNTVARVKCHFLALLQCGSF